MPVHKCPNGKYRIGSGGCNFTSKAKAEAAYKAYLAKKHNSKNEIVESIKQEIDVALKDFEVVKQGIIKLKIQLGVNKWT